MSTKIVFTCDSCRNRKLTIERYLTPAEVEQVFHLHWWEIDKVDNPTRRTWRPDRHICEVCRGRKL